MRRQLFERGCGFQPLMPLGQHAHGVGGGVAEFFRVQAVPGLEGHAFKKGVEGSGQRFDMRVFGKLAFEHGLPDFFGEHVFLCRGASDAACV